MTVQGVEARSLAALLGLSALRLVLGGPDCQEPRLGMPGTWPTSPHVGACAGIAMIGASQATVSLAAHCARLGLRCLILQPEPDGAPHDVSDGDGERWLAALGVSVFRVAASPAAVRAVAPALCETANLLLIDTATLPLAKARTGRLPASSADDVWWSASTLATSLSAAQAAHELLVVGDSGPSTAATLEALAASWRTETLALPFDEPATATSETPVALVGVACSDWAAAPAASVSLPASNGHGTGLSRVLTMPVSRREARAMQRLLAREEGVIVSERGAVGCAGLVRALFEDRTRRPRDRRLRSVSAVRLLLPGLRGSATIDPPPSEDVVTVPSVRLEDLAGSFAYWLVAPPAPHVSARRGLAPDGLQTAYAPKSDRSGNEMAQRVRGGR